MSHLMSPNVNLVYVDLLEVRKSSKVSIRVFVFVYLPTVLILAVFSIRFCRSIFLVCY